MRAVAAVVFLLAGVARAEPVIDYRALHEEYKQARADEALRRFIGSRIRLAHAIETNHRLLEEHLRAAYSLRERAAEARRHQELGLAAMLGGKRTRALGEHLLKADPDAMEAEAERQTQAARETLIELIEAYRAAKVAMEREIEDAKKN